MYLVVSPFVTYNRALTGHYNTRYPDDPRRRVVLWMFDIPSRTKSCLNLYHILEQIFYGAPGRIRTYDALANPVYKTGAVDHWATGACKNCEMYVSERCGTRTHDLECFPLALITN